jgi:hypothetical protein
MNRPQPAPRHRQETVLCLLLDEAPDALDGRTYVQKLMFLFQQRSDEDWFTFEAYDYGPFSRELYQVLDYCIEYDYVSESTSEDEHGRIRYHYEAGPAVGEVFGHGDHEELREVARGVFEDYPTDDLPALLDAVFTEYPAWARNAIY